MRLNQFLAKNLGISRREGDSWISQKKVKVENKLAEIGQKIEKESVQILENGNWSEISQLKNQTTILFYKPIFSLTTRNDPQKRKTIYNFLPKTYQTLKPAGRLDYMSEGLLVLSSDGELIQKLTHPKFNHQKEYLVALNGSFSTKLISQLKKGIKLDDYQLNSVKVEIFKDFEKFDYLKFDLKLNWYKFTLSEGRQNQIRRICQLDQYKVVRLIRISQGEFKLSQELYDKKHLIYETNSKLNPA
jgi:23S rRNA pseudouridine2605 synthase